MKVDGKEIAARGRHPRSRQEVQAHDRGRRRPARDEDGHPRAADAVDRGRCSACGRARRDRRRRRRVDALLAELRVPRSRCVARRATAAHLLVQRAARRVPALHRPRLAAGDRPRSRRAGSVALGRRRRARAVVARRLVGLLRGGDPGGRRPLRDRHLAAVAGADDRGPGSLPLRHRGREGLRPVPQPDGPAASVHARVRRHRLEPRAPVPRDRLVAAARADRGVHVAAPVSGLQGRAAQAGGARRDGRQAVDPRLLADVGERGARVSRRARPHARPRS